MPGWGAYVPEQEDQSHITDHVEEVEVRACDVMRSSPKCRLNECLNRLMHVNCSMMLLSAQVPVRPRLCRFGYCFGDLFKALHDMEEWGWGPSAR